MIGTAFPSARDAARSLAGFLWPQRCPGCGAVARPHELLCAACAARIPRLAFALCARCLAREAADPVCAQHPAHQVWPAWVYDERAALVVEAIKYGGRPRLARALGAELARVLPADARPDLITEVPLHPARQRERGFNQSSLLAAALADAFGVPHLPGALERTRATRAQARLGPRARRMNVRGAFRVRRPAQLDGRRVVVVDDVLTTGATLEACLDALAASGARGVATTLAWAQ